MTLSVTFYRWWQAEDPPANDDDKLWRGSGVTNALKRDFLQDLAEFFGDELGD